MSLIDVKVNFLENTEVQCCKEDCVTNYRLAPC